MKLFHGLRRRLIATTAALGVLVVCIAPFAMACSCIPELDVATALEQADAVFAGRVVALELVSQSDADPTSSFVPEDLQVTIAIHSTWKGDLSEQVTVFTTFTCCVCGFPFQIGAEYLIYADIDEIGRLRTSVCTRTTLLDNASSDLGVLGNLRPASLNSDIDSHEETSSK